MKNTKRIVLALAILLIVVMAAPAFAAANVTVGSLLQEIAKLNNLPAMDGNVAMQSLRAAGINIPALDTGRTLTEGDVVSISGAIGLNLSTESPDSEFSQTQLDGFMTSFGGELGTTGLDRELDILPGDDQQSLEHKPGHDKVDPLTKGIGKKVGLQSKGEPD